MDEQIKKLVTDLVDPSPSTRRRAAENLCRLGAESRCAAVPLVEATGDADETVREWATAALEDLGPPLPSDRDTLAKMANNANSDVAYWSITLLGRLGAEAADVAESLVRSLQEHSSAQVRQRAAWALGRIGNGRPEVLKALQAASRASDVRLARLAQSALRRLQRAGDSR